MYIIWSQNDFIINIENIYPPKVQRTKLCPSVGSGILNSMNHPKDQPFSLVLDFAGFTIRMC